MRRKPVPTTWLRRLTAPLRAFIRVDLDMTRQALRMAPRETMFVMCAPSMFLLWILDRIE